MTEERLKEIEARHSAAPKGPYSFHEEGQFDGEIRDGNFSHIANEMDGNNATGVFLAASWQDIADLLAEVKRLRDIENYADKLKSALIKCTSVMDMQLKRESEEFHLHVSAFKPMWDEAYNEGVVLLTDENGQRITLTGGK